MCTNEDKPTVSRAEREAGFGAEPLAHQGYEPLDERVKRQQAEVHARVGSGGIASNGRELGPKCLVAGCNNRFGEGVFHGELCAPCHRMIVTGYVPEVGSTFLHGMAGALKRQLRTPQELRNASLDLLNDLAPVTRRDAWWDTQGSTYIIGKHLEKYHEKGQGQ